MRSFMLFALMLVSTATMTATASGNQKPLAIAAITAQQAQIRAQVQAGTGRYKTMPEKTREELLSRQAKLLVMLDGKRSSDDLTSNQRTEAFNTLEWIEAAINNTPDDRMICKTQTEIGSNHIHRVCKTQAQMNAEHENIRQNLNHCGGLACGN